MRRLLVNDNRNFLRLIPAQRHVIQLLRIFDSLSLVKYCLKYCCCFYRPQRSWGNVMFLQASVILLTGRGRGYLTTPRADPPPRADTPQSRPSWSRHPPRANSPQGRHPPHPGADPPEQTPPWQHNPPKQTPPRADTPPASML